MVARTTNEWEFQGQALTWVNEEIGARNLGWDQATQEFPNQDGKRSDIIVWRDHATRTAILEIEIKTPKTALSNTTFQRDAIRKSQACGAPFYALWNMRALELYRTPQAPRKDQLSDDFVTEVGLIESMTRVEDWLLAPNKKLLRAVARNLLISTHDLLAHGAIGGQVVDATIFVDSLTERIGRLRRHLLGDFQRSLGTNRRLRHTINSWAVKQGLANFVDDLHIALSAQLAYRIAGQVLFYYSFRRQEPSLPALKLSRTSSIRLQLRTYWDAVRAFDYEALFAESPLEQVPLGPEAEAEIVALVEKLGAYDWDSVKVDVLGSIFEQMIPESERIVLGQYYTPPRLADLIVSLCTDGPDDNVLDPAVGTGTFLHSAYVRFRAQSQRSHADALGQLWGVDISAFPAELAVINLCRLDLSEQSNFPRVTVKDFFDLKPNEQMMFPPAKRAPGASELVAVELPTFDAVVGNPPYVRSQHLDDLEASYKNRLHALARLAGVRTSAKFDAFAYFIVHATKFLASGKRLGFVTSAAWLTASYGAVLQRFLLDKFRLVAVLWSEAEPFFPAQEINTVVVIAEKLDSPLATRGPIRFVTMTKSLTSLVAEGGDAGYWNRVDSLADSIEVAGAGDFQGYRVNLLDGDVELSELREAPTVVRNWARPLRSTAVYRDLFEGG